MNFRKKKNVQTSSVILAFVFSRISIFDWRSATVQLKYKELQVSSHKMSYLVSHLVSVVLLVMNVLEIIPVSS